MNEDFFEDLEKRKTKPMTDEEMEKFTNAMINSMPNNEQGKNIYQIVSIILMVVGFIGSIIIGGNAESVATIFIGLAITFISGLFMYGFGEIIKQLKIANTNLFSIKKKQKK